MQESVVNLKADIYTPTGEKSGTLTLPESIFGIKPNEMLLTQAVRVYQANKRQGTAHTKSRGEVNASTKKIYRQKGTGRARHGALSAPIFVGGGVAHGPKMKDWSLKMGSKMRQAAIRSALSSKWQKGETMIVDKMESLAPKTKNVYSSLISLSLFSKNKNSQPKTLMLLSEGAKNIARAGRNISYLTLSWARQVNAYELLSHKKVIILKDAVDTLEKTFAAPTKKQTKQDIPDVKITAKTPKSSQPKRKPAIKKVKAKAKKV